jgi:hypothetical protein
VRPVEKFRYGTGSLHRITTKIQPI